MHLSSQKTYDSIDHVVACGFYRTIFNMPQISACICIYKQFHTTIWVWIQYNFGFYNFYIW